MEKETVKRIAQLSRLKLSDEQLSSVAEYLDEMQECFSVLNCADLIGVCQTVSTLPFNNVFTNAIINYLRNLFFLY